MKLAWQQEICWYLKCLAPMLLKNNVRNEHNSFYLFIHEINLVSFDFFDEVFYMVLYQINEL